MFFFTSCDGAFLYMGKDKFENEDLIAHGWPEDVWFHVDNLSSAHVYVRQSPGRVWTDMSEEVIRDCAQLVKENSIEGCKKSVVTVIYTPWANLRKDGSMAVRCAELARAGGGRGASLGSRASCAVALCACSAPHTPVCVYACMSHLHTRCICPTSLRARTPPRPPGHAQTGQVSFHNPAEVKKVVVTERDKEILRRLEKTRVER